MLERELSGRPGIVFEVARPEYREGDTLGKEHKHWFRAKFLQQYRLFFRYSLADKTLVLVWVIDDQPKRTYDSRSDVYAVFRRMLKSATSGMARLISVIMPGCR